MLLLLLLLTQMMQRRFRSLWWKEVTLFRPLPRLWRGTEQPRR